MKAPKEQLFSTHAFFIRLDGSLSAHGRNVDQYATGIASLRARYFRAHVACLKDPGYPRGIVLISRTKSANS